LLEVPFEALQRRFGPGSVELDDTEYRFARVQARSDLTVEVGFAGVFRMFGALIDTQWVARRGGPPGEDAVELEYRFDKEAFRRGRSEDDPLARRLGTKRTRKLAGRAELKKIKVLDGHGGRLVEIIPLPGTITAVYFPPMPPYTVPIRPGEADDQLELLLYLADL
jgi:hypothetical protein